MVNTSLKRISPLSAFIVIGSDAAATPFEAAATFSVPVLGNIAVGVFFGGLAGLLVFLNEFYISKNLVESLLDGAIFGFLVGIPTPIAGVIAGGSQLVLK